jgi:hypothetical protein
MMRKIVALLLLACAGSLSAQQPQTSTDPVQRYNAKYNNGVGIGYWSTAGSGLTLNVAAGTSFCSGTLYTYAGGTLTMTASVTNYVYLNTSSSCAPATKTTAFTSSDIPVATVVAGSSTITSITDDRTMFIQGGSGSNTNPTFTVGSSLSAGSGSGLAIPGTSLTAGDIYYIGSSGPALAEANASSTVPGICLAISTTLCAYSGVYRFSSSQSWTEGQILYVSDATAGAILNTTPTTSGHYVQRIGIALANDTLLISPSLDVGSIQ